MTTSPSTPDAPLTAVDPMRAMTMPARDWTYDAVAYRVTDGDTAWFTVDLGGHVSARWRCRMRGYDAEPAKTTAGDAATAALRDLLYTDGVPVPLRIVTEKDGSDLYGRYLARVWLVADGREVGPLMVEQGHGTAWDGRGGHPAPAA